ncbi:MAG TPA: hypothetical protein VGA09_24465, partial [Candidatus Binatia bacterium]
GSTKLDGKEVWKLEADLYFLLCHSTAELQLRKKNQSLPRSGRSAAAGSLWPRWLPPTAYMLVLSAEQRLTDLRGSIPRDRWRSRAVSRASVADVSKLADPIN